MNDPDAFERFVAARFAREGSGPAATDEAIRELVTKAGKAGQRPRLLAILKEPPMRHASRVVVGSPTARVTALLAAALLMALLATGALVVGAQSPSPAPPEGQAAPQPPVEFTGVWCIGPAVAPDRNGKETTIELGDEGPILTRFRGGAWRNAVVMSDPRLQGDAFQTYESDIYHERGVPTGPGLIAATLSIANDEGAWVTDGTGAMFPDGTEARSANVFVGQGAYDGLYAIMSEGGAAVTRPESVSSEFGQCNEVEGVIFDGAPVPEAYLPD
jgi:hypothetical protein